MSDTWGDRPAEAGAPHRPLSLEELMAVAYAFHPRISLAEMDVMPIPEWKERFWNSPEQPWPA